MKNIQWVLLLSMVLAWNACEQDQFFELTNPPEFPWLNVGELERGIVTPYNIAFLSSWDNYFGNTDLISDCMSDLVYLIPNTSADIPYNEMYFRTTDVEINKANSIFSNAYKAIGACNSVIAFLDENNDEPYTNMTKEDKLNIRRIKGEAFFMRAYSYFHTVRIHGPAPGNPAFSSEKRLPLRVIFPTSYTEANEPEFVSAEQIYELIIDDLIQSMELLPEGFDPLVHHASYAHGRANRYAAAALLSRVYFLLSKFDLALPMLDYVISGPYRLDQDPIEAFNKNDESQGHEVIWYALYYDKA
ncbi:MAG: hypothetical protein HC819_21230, partial [Cyclobacteriaceae bacterium]|nr:hypothetical protein [Cyclobacteriaceae bacterium]